MKKRICAAVLILCLSLTGCGGGPGPAKDGEHTTSGGGQLYYSASPDVRTDASDSHGGGFQFYLPYGEEEHIRVSFIHGTRDAYDGEGDPRYHNGDVFRLDTGVIGTLDEDAFTERAAAIVPGGWEAAIYKDDRGSAVGTFHGWERFSRCLIQADGEAVADLTEGSVTIPEIGITEAQEIQISYWAEVHEMPQEGETEGPVLLDAFRQYTIDKDGIVLRQEDTWAVGGTHGMFVGMGCVSRALTDTVVCGWDGVEHDLSNGNETPVSGKANAKEGVAWARAYGSDTGVAMEIHVDPPCWFYVENLAEAKYNKLYFRHVEETEAGETWVDQTTFRFG